MCAGAGESADTGCGRLTSGGEGPSRGYTVIRGAAGWGEMEGAFVVTGWGVAVLVLASAVVLGPAVASGPAVVLGSAVSGPVWLWAGRECLGWPALEGVRELRAGPHSPSRFGDCTL